jgi:hypothetical protein
VSTLPGGVATRQAVQAPPIVPVSLVYSGDERRSLRSTRMCHRSGSRFDRLIRGGCAT